MMASTRPVGDLLREWRQRRHRSQLDLALEADISTKHLSFLETGRSQPSREMLLHLTDLLDIPLRERNSVLVAAGFAPMFPERPFNDPALAAARRAVELVLNGHDPFPAVAVDRHWNMIAANRSTRRLLEVIDPEMLQPPVNVLRLSLHPNGLAPRIVNHAEWREHLLVRLRHQIQATADPVLTELAAELESYPHTNETVPPGTAEQYGGVVVPLRLRTAHGVLSLFSTITIFGTPVDVTLSELALESFFPADPESAEMLRRVAEVGHQPQSA